MMAKGRALRWWETALIIGGAAVAGLVVQGVVYPFGGLAFGMLISG